MNRIEQLCHPLLRLLCETWCFGRSGAPIDSDALNKKIQNLLNDIRTQCESSPTLKREFAHIEQPLIFFVDYTIKEGQLPFSQEWREIARDYNELSGDEKFFDLLAETLDDPDDSERLLMFYLFMGLGFDGVYRNDPTYIERRMKLCATRTTIGQDLRKEDSPLFSPAPVSAAPKTHHTHTLYFTLVAVILLTLGALIYNYYVFRRESNEFRNSLITTTDLIRPVYSDVHLQSTLPNTTSEVNHE